MKIRLLRILVILFEIGFSSEVFSAADEPKIPTLSLQDIQDRLNRAENAAEFSKVWLDYCEQMQSYPNTPGRDVMDEFFNDESIDARIREGLHVIIHNISQLPDVEDSEASFNRLLSIINSELRHSPNGVVSEKLKELLITILNEKIIGSPDSPNTQKMIELLLSFSPDSPNSEELFELILALLESEISKEGSEDFLRADKISSLLMKQLGAHFLVSNKELFSNLYISIKSIKRNSFLRAVLKKIGFVQSSEMNDYLKSVLKYLIEFLSEDLSEESKKCFRAYSMVNNYCCTNRKFGERSEEYAPMVLLNHWVLRFVSPALSVFPGATKAFQQIFGLNPHNCEWDVRPLVPKEGVKYKDCYCKERAKIFELFKTHLL